MLGIFGENKSLPNKNEHPRTHDSVEKQLSNQGGHSLVVPALFTHLLPSPQAPVLAKRKTKAMKEMENASVKRAETRGKSAVRRANRTQQFVIPDHTTTDYERQLKKIATRGGEAMGYAFVSNICRLRFDCCGCEWRFFLAVLSVMFVRLYATRG